MNSAIIKSENKLIEALGAFPISQVVSSEVLEILKQEIGDNYQYLYYVEERLPEYFYFHNFAWIDVFALDIDALKRYRLNEHIEQYLKFCSKALSEKEYGRLYNRLPKRVRLPIFSLTYKQIPIRKRYDIFINIYQSCDYGFEWITTDIWHDILSVQYHSLKYWENRTLLKSLVDENGEIDIYRGENSLSRPVDIAISWSLSREVACFFAKRFEAGTLYVAKVKMENIIDYISDRNEQEVLIYSGSARIILIENYEDPEKAGTT